MQFHILNFKPSGSVLAGLSSPPPHLQQELQEQLQLHLQQQLQRQQQQHQSQQLEQFLQQVQVIVRNGFLDRRILTEPIPPETFDLVQMLIFYVIVSVIAILIHCLTIEIAY